MLQNTRLQRNGRRGPRSDDTMNDSCVKIILLAEDHDHEILSKLTANWLVLNFVDFLFHSRPRKFRNVWCFEFK